MDNKINYIESNKKEGQTIISWMPNGRTIVVKENKELEAKLLKSNIITTGEISDAELLGLGMTSKSANIANKSGEEQEVFEVVATGSETLFTSIGDKVMFMPGCQATSIKIKDKYYLQLGEFEVLGKFLD